MPAQAATALRFYFVSWLGERTVADIRQAVQRNLLAPRARLFRGKPAVRNRLAHDVGHVDHRTDRRDHGFVALRNTVMGIGGIAYLFSLSPKLTGGILLGIPVIIMPIVLLGRKLQNVSRSSQDRVADIGATTAEQLGAMKIVQAFGQEDREAERFTTRSRPISRPPSAASACAR
jgi:ATP-binding cassette subfamily B protein